jgi:predicted nucleotidyltransferase
MNNLNVREAINRIVDQIVEKYNPTKIILFGSAAQNQTDEINDVDFMIIKEEVPHYGVDRIRELYTLIESDIAVDYLVYRPDEIERLTSLKDPFIKEIVEKGKVLYG